MTYRFIDQHKGQWPVRWLCQTLEVSPASYYAWRRSPRSVGEQRRDALLVEIRAIHAQFKARYGSPRIHAELVARGHDCCVNTVAKLMREAGIAAKTARKFRCTTTFATRLEARAVIVKYIEVFYNNQRRHSSLGYVSPAEYEQSSTP